MAFSFANMRFFYLDDNAAVFTSYQAYRQSLVWRLWNKRFEGGTDGLPGANNDFADTPLTTGQKYNQGTGRAGKFLIGNYKDFNPANPGSVPSPQRDMIIDVSDPLITGFPTWQYTWVAIQNLAGNDPVYRLQMEEKAPDSFDDGFTGGPYNTNTAFSCFRPLGLFAGTGGASLPGQQTYLNNLTTVASPTFGNLFPHIVAYDTPTNVTEKIFWNACPENISFNGFAVPNYRKYYYGYNNRLSTSVNVGSGFTVWSPPQIARYAATVDPERIKDASGFTFPNRNRQCFDLPADTTLFGVIIKTSDSTISQSILGSTTITDLGSPKGWNYFDMEIKLAHLVIS